MIEIMQGDVTNPVWEDTRRIIIHSCNDVGGFGSGVAYSILKKWPHVAECYKEWHRTYLPRSSQGVTENHRKYCLYQTDSFRLGDIQIVKAEQGIAVCNIIGQKGVGLQKIGRWTIPPVRYEALFEGFLRVREWVKSQYDSSRDVREFTFHLPMLGAGLGGGNFDKVYEEYLEAFNQTSSRTMFYAFSENDFQSLNKIYQYYIEYDF